MEELWRWTALFAHESESMPWIAVVLSRAKWSTYSFLCSCLWAFVCSTVVWSHKRRLSSCRRQVQLDSKKVELRIFAFPTHDFDSRNESRLSISSRSWGTVWNHTVSICACLERIVRLRVKNQSMLIDAGDVTFFLLRVATMFYYAENSPWSWRSRKIENRWGALDTRFSSDHDSHW